MSYPRDWSLSSNYDLVIELSDCLEDMSEFLYSGRLHLQTLDNLKFGSVEFSYSSLFVLRHVDDARSVLMGVSFVVEELMRRYRSEVSRSIVSEI